MERKKSAFDGRDRMITVHRTRECGARLAGARSGRQSRAPTNPHGEARCVVSVYADFSLRGGVALPRRHSAAILFRQKAAYVTQSRRPYHGLGWMLSRSAEKARCDERAYRRNQSTSLTYTDVGPRRCLMIVGWASAAFPPLGTVHFLLTLAPLHTNLLLMRRCP